MILQSHLSQPVMGELPSLLGAVQVRATDLVIFTAGTVDVSPMAKAQPRGVVVRFTEESRTTAVILAEWVFLVVGCPTCQKQQMVRFFQGKTRKVFQFKMLEWVH